MDASKLQAQIARLRLMVEEIEVQRNVATNNELQAKINLRMAKETIATQAEVIEQKEAQLVRKDAEISDLKRKMIDADAAKEAPELPMSNGDDSHCPA